MIKLEAQCTKSCTDRNPRPNLWLGPSSALLPVPSPTPHHSPVHHGFPITTWLQFPRAWGLEGEIKRSVIPPAHLSLPITTHSVCCGSLFTWSLQAGRGTKRSLFCLLTSPALLPLTSVHCVFRRTQWTEVSGSSWDQSLQTGGRGAGVCGNRGTEKWSVYLIVTGQTVSLVVTLWSLAFYYIGCWKIKYPPFWKIVLKYSIPQGIFSS